MKKAFIYIFTAVLLAACGSSYDEQKRLSQVERAKIQKEDSAALKVAVVPTIESLPIFLAKERLMYDTTKVDLRVRVFNAQMDCDTAFVGGSVDGMLSDDVRVGRIREKGTSAKSMASTDLHWQLIANRKARVKEMGQLSDKMVAMTRFSATDVLTDKALDGVKLSSVVFRIQVNDVNVRLLMLLNNEMDAAWLAEPYATAARLKGHLVLADSRKMKQDLGVVVFRSDIMKRKNRKGQVDAFLSSYDKACDSLNTKGIMHYADVIHKYYRVNDETLKALSKYRFKHLSQPEKSAMSHAKQQK